MVFFMSYLSFWIFKYYIILFLYNFAKILIIMKGHISSIQRMSIHDGPGIRTTVFLKGCNLRCRWCHNPETWISSRQLQYFPSLCVSCGDCIAVCPQSSLTLSGSHLTIDRSSCISCGMCADVCLSGALYIIGMEMEVSELVGRLLEDRPFYDSSGGGVTISGGEPFMQPGFTRLLLEKCKDEGLHTVVQTNLCVQWERIEEALPYVDMWMCDLKCNDSLRHREWTGADNLLVKDNLMKLAESGADLTVRTPVIPGFNDDEKEVEAMCRFLKGIDADIRYELLPFHDLGYEKFRTLGMENQMGDIPALSHDDIRKFNDILKQYAF